MRYVSANSDVPVPKVLGMMTDPEDTKINYIIMQFVEGQCMDAIWSDLSATEQEDVKSQLKAAISSMRLMPDQGYVGTVGHQRCCDGVFIAAGPEDSNTNGLFVNENEMNEGSFPLTQTYKQEDVKSQLKAAISSMRLMPDQGYVGTVGHQRCCDGVFIAAGPEDSNTNGLFVNENEMNEGMLSRLAETEPPSSIRLFRTILSNLSKHRIVSTHADLQARNMLVRRGGHGIAERGKTEITIVDWEYSGWYREYWEFCNSLIFNTFRTEWHVIIQDTLGVYTNEDLLMQKIRNILFY
ncbi:hypothetical protein MBLNU13_g07712t1 [Cladosporium sp. NU13]